jgi:hypothetical protein
MYESTEEPEMKWKFLSVLALFAAGSLALSTAQAGSLAAADLPTDSNWYVHVNLDLVRNSVIGRQFMRETFDEAMDDIEDELGVDVREEFEGVTVFGGSLPDGRNALSDGAVVLHGMFSEATRSAFLSALKDKGAKYTEAYEAGMTYYIVENDEGMSVQTEDGELQEASFDPKEELYFSFGSAQTLITQSPEMMQLFLSGGGYLGGFEQVNDHALLVLQADRALLQGGANTSEDIAGDWDSSVLKNIDAFALVIGEQADGLLLSAQLVADSAEVAMSVRNIVEGMVALKALNEPEGVVGEVLRNVRFENDGPVLGVRVEVTAGQVAALKDL